MSLSGNAQGQSLFQPMPKTPNVIQPLTPQLGIQPVTPLTEDDFKPKIAVDGFIISGYLTPDDWRFIMGPREAPDMVMRLTKRTDSGAVGFECRRGLGTMEMNVVLPGVHAPEGTEQKFDLHVGHEGGTSVLKALASKDTDTPFSLSGLAVSDILGAMGNVSENQDVTFDVFTDGKSVSFALPSPHNTAKVASVVCASWAEMAHPGTIPQPAQPSQKEEAQLPDGVTLRPLPGGN